MTRDAITAEHSKRHALGAMNRLILACKEDALAENDATRAVRDPEVAAHLRLQARRRSAFVDDLHRAIVTLGGRPATDASAAAWARSILRHMRAVVGGWHEGDGYAAMLHAEERTARAYVDALSGWLPNDARFGVMQQRAQIETDLDDARRLRGQH